MQFFQTDPAARFPAARPEGPARCLPALAVLALIALLAGCASSPGTGGSGAAGKALVGAARSAKPGTTFVDCPGCPQMIIVPPGSFMMGFDGGEPERYEGPVRDIRIGYAFAVARYEVTNAQYRAFVADTGHAPTQGCFVPVGNTYKPLPGADWQNPGYGRPILDDEPVACVTWTDAKAYVVWLANRTGRPYRLLTEAEWEYAARAGRAGRFTWGDAPQTACKEANVFDQSAARARTDAGVPAAPCDDGFPGLAPVGRFAPNAFGLFDMIGNVWEWVEDCYTMPHLAGAPVDGSAQVTNGCDRRGTKGGAWMSSVDRQRPAFRGRDPVDRISQIFGFRVARD